MDDARPTDRTWTPRLAGGLVAITAVQLAVAGRWIVAPLGLSHDGRNTAVFALGARAIARFGFVGARGGSVLADGAGDYAHHPPSLVWAMRATTALLGEHPWALRLPTVLASVAAVWLLAGLLRDLGASPFATLLGVVVAVANPIVWIYGGMADTPMWALPFALAATRSWRRGRRAAGPWALACGLAGWQAVLWCVLLVAAGWRRDRRTSLVVAGGIGAGVALTVAWIAWSVPGLASLAESAGSRTGTGDAALTVGDAASQSLRHLLDMWTPVTLLLVVPMGVLAWRRNEHRPVLAVAAGGVVGYAAAFWQAASIHDYWNLWAMVPLALVVGLGADELAVVRGPAARRWAAAAASVAVAAAPFGALDARNELAAGAELGRIVRDAPLPARQPGWVVAGLPGSDAWVAYATDRPVVLAPTLTELQRLAARHPSWWVLVPCRLAAGDRCGGVHRPATVVLGVAAGPLERVVPALAPTAEQGG